MAKRVWKKPRLTFQVEDEDKAALDAVTAKVKRALPGVREQAQSLTLRAALRLGLAALDRDPEAAAKVQPPTIAPDASAQP